MQAKQHVTLGKQNVHCFGWVRCFYLHVDTSKDWVTVMSEVRPTYDDEIDLFELFEMVWNGRWLITLFVAIAVSIGGSFLLLKDASYESKLIYSIDTLPPFYAADKALIDFQNMFYSANLFNAWKKNNSNSTIMFEDFSMTEVVDGVVVSKNGQGQLATIVTENKGDPFISIKSNQLPILDDFFEYAQHINALLKDKYVVRATNELLIIEGRFNDISTTEANIINLILSIDRFVVSMQSEASVLTIKNPTLPQKVSPKSSLILAFSIVLGGMVGVCFILVRNAITKRKEQLVKA